MLVHVPGLKIFCLHVEAQLKGDTKEFVISTHAIDEAIAIRCVQRILGCTVRLLRVTELDPFSSLSGSIDGK